MSVAARMVMRIGSSTRMLTAAIAAIVVVGLVLATATSASAAAALDDYLRCLAERVPVVVASSPSFSLALNISIENLRFSTASQPKPLLIALPESTEQVQVAVLCAVRTELLIRVRAGGHAYEGQSSVADAGAQFVIIDMQKMTSVEVVGPPESAVFDDGDSRIRAMSTISSGAPQARTQAGATLGQLYYQVSQATGDAWTFPGGSCPTVGLGGYLSGGGYGLLGRSYALASDHVLDATLVTSDGRILTRDTMPDDVFWALRGGGGGAFGIVVDWTLELVPVPASVTVFGAHVHGVEQVAEAIAAWQAFAPSTRDELYLSCFISTFDDGKDVSASFSALSLLPLEDTVALVQAGFPLLNLTSDDASSLTYLESVLHFGVGLPPNPTLEDLMDRVYHGKSYYAAKSDFVQEALPKEGIMAMLQGLLAHPHDWMMLDPYGGQQARVPADACPFPHRAGTLFSIQYQSVWDEPSQEDEYRAGLRDLYERMKPYMASSPARPAYTNYPDADLGYAFNGTTSVEESEAWGLPYYGANYARLTRAKAQIDPTNVFRSSQSVQPAITTNGVTGLSEKRGRRHRHHEHDRKIPSLPIVHDSIPMPVNHSDPNSPTFQLRVQWCTSFYAPEGPVGGPLLVGIGPERALADREIDLSSLGSFFGPKLGGIVFMIEHRFYGYSLPFGDDSFTLEALAFLTIEQALADYEAAIQWFLAEIVPTILPPRTPAPQVLTFGGSYGGYLSAMMRINYPSLVTGALASCTAPWLASPFVPDVGDRWARMVGEAFVDEWKDEECKDAIQEAMATLKSDFDLGHVDQIQEGLQLCAPAVTTKASDVNAVFAMLKRGFSFITLFNYPVSSVFCDKQPLQAFCTRATAQAHINSSDPYAVLRIVMQMTFNTSGTATADCLPWNGAHSALPSTICTKPQKGASLGLLAYSPSAFPPPPPSPSHKNSMVRGSGAIDPWLYQACTEFVFGAGGGTGIFAHGYNWTLAFAQRACAWAGADRWAPRPAILDPTMGTSGASFTNMIFSRASSDPNRGWTPEPSFTDAAGTVVAIALPHSGHCADLVNFGAATPPALQGAMDDELQVLSNFLVPRQEE